jgi:hypothetical protein
MVSTPSRSRQATRISLPDIVGPTSARLASDLAGAAGVLVFVAVSVVLLITIRIEDYDLNHCLSGCKLWPQVQ